MYLTEPKFFDIVIRQFRFKMNANAAAFTTLVLSQVVLLFASLSNVYSHRFDTITTYEHNLSNDTIVWFTLFWALILGFILTSAAQRNESFAFVTNRLSYQLANFLFILTASVIGGVTSVLTGSVVKLYALLRFGDIVLGTPGLIAAPSDFFIRIATAIAYTMLFFMAGYTIGMFIQLNKIFILLFIGGWIFLEIIDSTSGGISLTQNGFAFFGSERSIALFLLKVSGTTLGLFAICIAITNRLEVRK
ncbi:hypothetical protein [Sporosarcina sp. NPDC096371]|uniref:hypothetical protein n=1 Tax=Sporosarcina sp. NPDC096371 TaxID=3364530 RepID=UPI00382339BB